MKSIALQSVYGNSVAGGYGESRSRDELCDAYTLGRLDALDGEMACPEMYVSRRVDMELYCAGFESIAGPTLTTRHFLDSARYVFSGQQAQAVA